MKPARAIADRDLKPDNDRDLTIRWLDDISADSRRRVLRILQDILNRAANPDEVRRK